MNIVVLAGGTSPERNVSLMSGAMITQALRRTGYKAVLVDSFWGPQNMPGNAADFFDMPQNDADYVISKEAPDIAALTASRDASGKAKAERDVLALCRAADIVFMALHGDDGENGKYQAVFDLAGVKYTGAGSFGCSLAMHKDVAKHLCAAWNIKVPQGRLFDGSAFTGGDRMTGADSFGFPCVVKPCCGGSSIGVSIVMTKRELDSALSKILGKGDSAVVEQYIEGREFSVGILGDEALPAIEIIPKGEFYDYEHKYQPGLTQEICPPDLPAQTHNKLRSIASLAFYALHLSVYARGEFIMSPTGDIYFLEMNALPGMTPMSLLPQEAKAAGYSYDALCKRIVELSLRKYNK